jgi:hypothetical protein
VDALTLFGLTAVSTMLIFYALEDHSPWYILAFAGACVLQGAWPFGIIEALLPSLPFAAGKCGCGLQP